MSKNNFCTCVFHFIALIYRLGLNVLPLRFGNHLSIVPSRLVHKGCTSYKKLNLRERNVPRNEESIKLLFFSRCLICTFVTFLSPPSSSWLPELRHTPVKVCFSSFISVHTTIIFILFMLIFDSERLKFSIDVTNNAS